MSDETAQPVVLPKDDGIRPAGRPDTCFYCKQRVGTPHGETCVVVRKVIQVRLIDTEGQFWDYTDTVPRCWTPDQVLFKLNESSYCITNAVQTCLRSHPDDEKLQQAVEADVCLCYDWRCALSDDWDQPEVLVPQDVEDCVGWALSHLEGVA